MQEKADKQVIRILQEELSHMVQSVWQDGVVTPEERTELFNAISHSMAEQGLGAEHINVALVDDYTNIWQKFHAQLDPLVDEVLKDGVVTEAEKDNIMMTLEQFNVPNTNNNRIIVESYLEQELAAFLQENPHIAAQVDAQEKARQEEEREQKEKEEEEARQEAAEWEQSILDEAKHIVSGLAISLIDVNPGAIFSPRATPGMEQNRSAGLDFA